MGRKDATKAARLPSNANNDYAPAELSLTHGGWCGPVRDGGVGPTMGKKVAGFLLARPSVLHVDELINKKDPVQVRYLLTKLTEQKTPIQVPMPIDGPARRASLGLRRVSLWQVAFFQGTVPLESDILFPRLLHFLEHCPVWSINLGELRFSEEQCTKLAETLKLSGVTHMHAPLSASSARLPPPPHHRWCSHSLARMHPCRLLDHRRPWG